MPKPTTRLLRCAAASVALIAVAATVPAEGSSGAAELERAGADGLIAFASTKGSGRLMLIDPRTGERFLQRRRVYGHDPAFSPDGQRIASVTSRGLEVTNANGTDRRTIYRGLAILPRFSADGRRVWFTSRADAPGYDIYSVRLNGRGLRREIEVWDSGSSPSPTPDGRFIAFEHGAGGPDNWDIALYDTVTGDRTELTSDASSRSPAFSPDGERIAFVREVNGNADVYVMDADGSIVQQVTDDPADDVSPSWSPDGSRISFSSYRDRRANVYVIDSDGENEVNLTQDETRISKFAPDWGAPDEVAPRTRLVASPDGAVRKNPKRIRFRADEAVTMPRQVRFRCRIDSRPAVDCDSPLRTGSLGPGRHRVAVVAIDRAGNRDQTPAVARWRVKR